MTGARVAGAELAAAIGNLERSGTKSSWRGPDPYEGLNARRGGPLMRSQLGRRILIQLVKRSPLDLRPVLGIEPQQNSAALAAVLSAYVRIDMPADERARRVAAIADDLEQLRCTTFPEPCWGYHFDVETRFFFYSKATPNTIATAFTGMALLDAAQRVDDPRLLQLATGAGEFFLRHIPCTAAETGAFFGYLPGDRTPIHNASMLVAAFLSDLAARSGEARFADAAAPAIAYALASQRPDGSWPYAETANGGWIDGYHTGYVLDSLWRCAQGDFAGDIGDAYRRGLSFYADALFLDDGTPKFTNTSTYPIDSQCVAQGIRSFALGASVEPEYLKRAWGVFEFAIRRMRRRDGRFIFQRRRWWANRVPHVRWTQAPMLDAMAHLAEASERRA